MGNNDKMHDKYLPFAEKVIKKHLYGGDGRNKNSIENQLIYYKDSIKRFKDYQWGKESIKGKPLKETSFPCQIQKDERFWTMNTLLSIFYSQNRTKEFVRLFKKGYSQNVPKLLDLNSWDDCFQSDNLGLYFEVDLPSPIDYKDYLLKKYKDKKSNQHQIVSHILASACNKKKLEGSTQVDAIIINPDNGFGVIIEAKVLSDISISITYDLLRNQIARTIDVMLEKNEKMKPPFIDRNPDKTIFLLLTPKLFKNNPWSRFYGYKMRDYKDPEKGVDYLKEDLPHRTEEVLKNIPSRIGWLTWKDFKDVNNQCSPWDIDYDTYF